MSFWTNFRRPVPADYDSDEEYQEALAAYEYAEYFATENRHSDEF